MLQAREASDHQPRADQQRQRQRHFGHDQEAAPAHQDIRGDARSRAALFERQRQIGLRRLSHLQSRSQAEEDSCQQREQTSEAEHAAIYADLLRGHGVRREEIRRVVWDQSEQIDAPPRQQYAGPAAQQRQQQALDKQLPHDPETPCAQRHTDGKLPAPRRRARQLQIRHVDTGDQQQEPHSAEQHQQPAPQLPTGLFAERDGLQPPARVEMRLGLFHSPRDGVQFGLGGGQAHSRFQSRDDAERARPARVLAILEGIETKRQPDFSLFRKAREAEALGQYAADFSRLPVERYRTSDQRGIGAEAPAPKAVADDHGGRVSGVVFFGAKCAAQQRLNAERGEEISRDNRVLHTFRLIGFFQI